VGWSGAGPVRWSWRIGRLAGIALYVHATFVLLLAWVAFREWRYGLAAVAAALVYIVALFAIVVLHELGHALTARRYGIRTRDIILLPIGGVARLEHMPRDPRQELLVALAGPGVNVGIAVALYALVRITGAPPAQDLYAVDIISSTRAFAYQLVLVNILLAVFNLIPAFPMDGGRVLRAVLAMRMSSYVRATAIAARVGRVLAVILGFIGVYEFQNPFWVLIALFIWMGARSEAAAVYASSAPKDSGGDVPIQDDGRRLEAGRGARAESRE
jgi:Zn-dependent protease